MLATTETRMNAASAALLEQAETLFSAGDLRRASGKAWEAVERPLSAMMREREWDGWEAGDDEMGRLIRFAGFISQEADDPGEFLDLLASAGLLSVNAQEDGNVESLIRVGIDCAKELITLLERIDESAGMDKERPVWRR